MHNTTVLPAPELMPTPVPTSKWEAEYQAFLRLRPELLADHRGMYVAVHNGQVIDSGEDQMEVALRSYRRFGYVPIYVGLVTDESPLVARVPSPRIMQQRGA